MLDRLNEQQLDVVNKLENDGWTLASVLSDGVAVMVKRETAFSQIMCYVELDGWIE